MKGTKKQTEEQKKLIGVMVEAYVRYFIMEQVAKEMAKDKDFRKITSKYLGWKWLKKKSRR
jgi:hypothetical protein